MSWWVSRPVMVGVMGPTGSGKTALAEALAEWLGARLVNADAFQVYRGLDIGTAKPERRELYALLDVVEVTEGYGVGEWVAGACGVLREAWSAGESVVIVGGTGFYVRALFERYGDLQGPPDAGLRRDLERREREEGLGSLVAELWRLDAVAAGRTDLANGVRVRRALERALGGSVRVVVEYPDFGQAKFGLWPEVGELDLALSRRVDGMVAGGWVDEVGHIVRSGVPVDSPGLRAIGYHGWVEFLEGGSTYNLVRDGVVLETRQYAKRQRTWLRSEPGLELVPLPSLGACGFEFAFRQARESLERMFG